MSRSTFLAARLGSSDLGLETSRVRRVVPASEWDGPPAVDLSLLTFGEAEEQTAVHIILVETSSGERALATSRPLVVRQCEHDEPVSLPPEIWPTDSLSPFSGLLCQPGQPPLLILAHRALDHARRIPVASGDPS